MPSILILADDLTGAADTAARCRHAGLPATIYLRPPRPPVPTGVVAFTSDSRHLPPEDAAQRVRDVAEPLRDTAGIWYKKIDSTLRGNLGSELDALLDLMAGACAVICPAFPAQDRSLCSGRLVAANAPPGTIDLPSLLRAQSRRSVVAIPLANLRSGKAEAQLREARQQGGELFVIDAMTNQDLDQILDVVEQVMPEALLCGSAGLIGALAEREVTKPRDNEATTAEDHQVEHEFLARPVSPTGDYALDRAGKPSGRDGRSQNTTMSTLIVAGSGSEMAHRQIAALLSQRPVNRVILDAGLSSTSVVEQCDPTQPIGLLHLPQPTPDTILDGPTARRWAEHLSEAAAIAVATLQPALLILTGGDTAVHVLSRLGIHQLDVLAELLPGMPLCTGTTGSGHRYRVIMKPGSFGDKQTLLTLLERAAIHWNGA